MKNLQARSVSTHISRAVRSIASATLLWAAAFTPGMLHAQSTTRLDALLDEIGEIDGVLKTTTSVVLALRIDRTA